MRDVLATGILTQLATGPKTAKELIALLGISQPTFSRALVALGEQIVTMGRGRATRYARPRLVRGFSGRFPAYCIGEDGSVRLIGILQALAGGSYWWLAEDGESESRHFDHLPWFVQDMRPDGFIGRAFAQRHNRDLGLPEKLGEWNDDDLLLALTRRGEDHIGNLLLGDESLERYLRSSAQPPAAIPLAERADRYAELARSAQAGDPPGSSAGGEQPKFTALVGESDLLRSVLVKFSPPLIQPEGVRWADLLRCEDLALHVIAGCGIAAARTAIVAGKERVFLEVERFDRRGRLGRKDLFSLRAIDAAFVGCGSDWLRCAAALQHVGVISPDDARRMRWLKLFGDLIANSDMHAGNLSFHRLAAGRYTLAPVYDMLPMLYRPMNGEIVARTFVPPLPGMETVGVWAEALNGALHFWSLAAKDGEISEDFRGICRENHLRLQVLQGVPVVGGR